MGGGKRLLDFGDLGPVSRSQEVKNCWKMACLHSVSRKNDLNITSTDKLLGHVQDSIRF